MGHESPHPEARVEQRVLVLGCGGIGGILAAGLTEGGVNPLVVTTNAGIAAAVNRDGFRLQGAGGERVVRGRVHLGLPAGAGPFDFVFLALPPNAVEQGAADLIDRLAPEGAFVCLQNGLGEERLAARFGEDRVLGAIVSFGASTPEVGVFDQTSEGRFTLGRLNGAADPRLDALDALLRHVAPVDRTDNLRGARWSKLAFNCAVSTLGTIGGDRLGPLVQKRVVRRLALEIMTESVRVAAAEGVRLEKLANSVDLNWLALTPEEQQQSGSLALFVKHSAVLAAGARYRRMRSSMLAALERGRTPPVDFLNGEIVARGAAHGIPTPVNAAAQATVHAIAAGKAQSGLSSIYALAAELGL